MTYKVERKVERKLIKAEKEKIMRIKKALVKVQRAEENLRIARYRRKQAEEGHTFKALF